MQSKTDSLLFINMSKSIWYIEKGYSKGYLTTSSVSSSIIISRLPLFECITRSPSML